MLIPGTAMAKGSMNSGKHVSIYLIKLLGGLMVEINCDCEVQEVRQRHALLKSQLLAKSVQPLSARLAQKNASETKNGKQPLQLYTIIWAKIIIFHFCRVCAP